MRQLETGKTTILKTTDELRLDRLQDELLSETGIGFGKYLLTELDSMILIVISALVAVLSFFDRITHKYWEAAVLGILTMVAVKVVKAGFETKRELANKIKYLDERLQCQYIAVQQDFSELLISMRGPSIHEAEVCDQKRFYEHLTRAMQACSRSVDLTQLDADPPSYSGIEEKKRYFKLAAETVIAKPGVQFRRIVSIPNPTKLRWVLDLIDEVQNSANYSMHYVDITASNFFLPPLSIQIFDSHDVMVVDPTRGFMPTAPVGDQCLWIQGKEAPRVFTNYFQNFWNLTNATRLKEGNVIHWGMIREIAERLKPTYPDDKTLSDCLKRIP